MLIPSEALVDCLDQFKTEWESTACPVCDATKWKNSPFCRRCSILLQRAHLMRPFRSWTLHSLEACFRMFLRKDETVVYKWTLWYDLCRDYLASGHKKREPEDFSDSLTLSL